MLMDIVKIKCDIFPKTKYRLYVNNVVRYYFVTTRHSEEKCIEMMVDRIRDYSCADNVYYKIVKVKDDKEIILKRGKL